MHFKALYLRLDSVWRRQQHGHHDHRSVLGRDTVEKGQPGQDRRADIARDGAIDERNCQVERRNQTEQRKDDPLEAGDPALRQCPQWRGKRNGSGQEDPADIPARPERYVDAAGPVSQRCAISNGALESASSQRNQVIARVTFTDRIGIARARDHDCSAGNV